MIKTETLIPGCYELALDEFSDERGKLVKTFHQDTYIELGLDFDIAEAYFTTSKHRVLRGMHFQIPPYEHFKCVMCLQGLIFDVVVDLRVNSPTYKLHFTTELDSESSKLLYIPKGCAHGFYTLSETSVILTRATTIYKLEEDAGIRWDSCGITWPDWNPIVSEKDKNLPLLNEFNSPF